MRLERSANLGAAGCQVARTADALRVLAVEQHQAVPSVADVHHHLLSLCAHAAASCRRHWWGAGGAGVALLQAGGPWAACRWRSRDGLPPWLTVNLHVRVAELALDLQSTEGPGCITFTTWCSRPPHHVAS